MNVGVVGNPRFDELPRLLGRLQESAEARGLHLFTEPDIAPLWPDGAPPLIDPSQLQCLLTFGGDGTLLRGARMLDRAKVPVLGVNIGRVGFLTAATPETLEDALDSVRDGTFVVEPRKALDTHVVSKDGRRGDPYTALNDVVVHKGGVARVVAMRVTIDDEVVGSYRVDGIIVATPTGSTAYNLSAGGPIVIPGVDCLILTAICPHTLAVRPIVMRSDARIEIEPTPPWTDDVLISIDGQVPTELAQGDRVVIEKSANAILLARVGPERFFARMRSKLQWGDSTGPDAR